MKDLQFMNEIHSGILTDFWDFGFCKAIMFNFTHSCSQKSKSKPGLFAQKTKKRGRNYQHDRLYSGVVLGYV